MNQKRKMRYTSQKGITLIALVITIIVLLILAGVTINMVLGDDGIISQAQDAKKAQQESEDTQAIKLATGEAATSEHLGVLTAAEVEKQSDITFDENPYNNSIREILKFGDKYLPIPKGMAYAYGTIDEGAVVVDKYGNEFVWVPVDQVLASGTINYEDDAVSLINNNNDKSSDSDDYEAMKKSVSLYGGFYVGRYETSWTGTKVASVRNVVPINKTTPIEMVDTDHNETRETLGSDWYTFYNKQKELYNKDSDSVTSGMIYGSQWNAIMDWMSDVKNPYAIDPENNLYIKDSTGMGHYNASEPIETGSNSNYAVKNIFDLAGNYFEWTQEVEDSNIVRGGDYNYSGCANEYDGAVGSYDYYVPEFAYPDVSTRLQLYIK